MREGPGLTVAVPCRDEVGRVPRLAAALRRLDPPPDALLVFDDGSRDGTAAAAEGEGLPVLRSSRHVGLGSGRNALWQACATPLIAYLDADVEPPPDWVARVWAIMADPSVAGAGGWNRDLTPRTAADRFRERHWRQWNGPIRLDHAPWLVGACASYRRSALAAVSGFDPRLRSHGEDVDLGLRLNRSGFRLVYDPTLQVLHQRSDTAVTLARMAWRHCRWGGTATLRNDGSLAPLVLGMAAKAWRAPLGLALRHRDPRAAAAGALACGAGLAGYLAAAAGRDR